MSRKFRTRTPYHPPLPEDALYKALVARVVAALSGYSDLKKSLATSLDALRHDPGNLRMQTEIAHITCQLYEAKGRSLASVDAFTLAFPDSYPDDHANIRTAIRITGLDTPLPTPEEALQLASDFLSDATAQNGGDAS